MKINKFPIIVRMDDICPTMDKTKFSKYIDLFDELNIKPLLGIIPLCEDVKLIDNCPDCDFYEKMAELVRRGYTISMHGCHHVLANHGSSALLTDRESSEFAGLTFDEQKSLLEKGKAELEKNGIVTEIFMPPAHSFDLNTISALASAGFKYVTDGLSLKPYSLNGIKFIPADSSYRLHKMGLLTVCIHSETDDYDKIECFIRSHLNSIITFGEALNMPEISYSSARTQERIRLHVRRFISRIHVFARKKR